MLSAVLAVVEAAVGAYLSGYAPGREHHDQDAVLATGGLPTVCAGPLVLLQVRQPGQLIGQTPPERQV